MKLSIIHVACLSSSEVWPTVCWAPRSQQDHEAQPRYYSRIPGVSQMFRRT